MKRIVTLTLNPCVDASCETETVHPTHKIRTTGERYDPGGGGINVARVIAELGGPATAVYLGGGATGALFRELLAAAAFESRAIPIHDLTRISHSVYERATGLEYRFTPDGPAVGAEEWRACLDAVREMDFDYIVASGSSPRGVPETCYTEIAAIARARGARFVLDTSGPVLKATVAGGGIFLAKPSLGELRVLAGAPLHTADEVEAAALALTDSGALEYAAVTLGRDGAMLAGHGQTRWLMPPEVEVKSAVGAGDSFLGAMLFGLARGDLPQDAFVLGVAAGAASVTTAGTQLCRKRDVERFFRELRHRPNHARPEGYVISG
jgi:6-phosphofructokinase 2